MIKFLLILMAMIPITLQGLRAQAPIPNGDFEQWSGGAPVGWTVDDTTVAGQSLTPITQTSDAEKGSSALMGSVVGIGFQGTNFAEIPPLLIAGTPSANNAGGFPYTDQPNSMTGFYKYNPVGGDSISIVVAFVKNGVGVGGGGGNISVGASSYTPFS
ncbi:MAG TPA: hypothetical protein VGM92_09985, partial [Candidatus Kapabacteria bacterium]